jgi:hypothetical protein
VYEEALVRSHDEVGPDLPSAPVSRVIRHPVVSVHIETHSCFVCFFCSAKVARAGMERGFNHPHAACAKDGLLVQDNTEERTVDLKAAVVMNEAQFPELVHEKVYPRTGGPNHFCQHLLRYFRKHFLRLGLLTIAGEQQESSRQPLLAGIKQLIDQILLDSDVP